MKIKQLIHESLDKGIKIMLPIWGRKKKVNVPKKVDESLEKFIREYANKHMWK